MFCINLCLTKKKIVFTALVLILVTAVLLSFNIFTEKPAELKYCSTEERVGFASSFGWTADPLSEKQTQIVIPDVFEGSADEYNKIQISQGFDLTRYAGQQADLYTYDITDYPGHEKNVYIRLICIENNVVGGDIYCNDFDGFIHGINVKSGEK